MTDDFPSFLKAREAAARAFVSGDPGPVVALSAQSGTATFFDPGGGSTTGAEAINAANASGSKNFGPGGTTRFEILDQGEDATLAFWTGYQVAEVRMGDRSVPMRLRITEIFRRGRNGWQMVHRHASQARELNAPG